MKTRDRYKVSVRLRWLAAAAAVLLSSAVVSAQSVPAFEVDAVTMPDPKTLEPRLDIYTRIPYSNLQFISQSGGFVSQYSVLAELYRVDEDGNQQAIVVSRIWERNVPVVTAFDETLSGRMDYTTHSISGLDPGVYLLEIQIEDGFSNKSFLKQIPVRVRSMDKRASLSDVLLADSFDPSSKSLIPAVSNVVENDRGVFILYYEIATKEAMMARVSYAVFRLKEADDMKSVKAMLRGGRRETPSEAEMAFEALDLLPLAKGRNRATLPIPLEDFKVGDFAISVKVSDENGVALDSVYKLISVRWMGLHDQIQNVDEAVEQLAYIAKGREIDYLLSPESEEERASRFRSFWKKRDPTPLSDRNERMEEYYFRIAHANKEYGNFSKGWQTDRGQVFVVYGEPDYVERHTYSFGVSKPYEIWTYNSLGRQFVFIDRTGVGDFQLLVPIWDERTRIR